MANFSHRLGYMIKSSKVVIDNDIFTLHYTVTAFILVLFSAVVLCNYSGESTSCDTEEDIVPLKYLNTFCQLIPTSNSRQLENVELGSAINDENHFAKRHDTYYQVDDLRFSFLLIFQALLFMAPRLFWKFMESGRIEILVTFLYNNENRREENMNQLTDVLTSAKRDKKYLWCYIAAELMNALNVTACIIMLGMFFENSPYNTADVIEFGDVDWSPCWEGYCSLGYNLPKLTQCTIHKYTTSGDVLTQQAAMVSPTHIIYQKMSTFLRCWFYMVACLSYLVLSYRIFLIISPTLRVKVLNLRCRSVESSDLVLIVTVLGIENWFLINLLSKNIDSETFSDSIAIMGSKIRYSMNNSTAESEEVDYQYH